MAKRKRLKWAAAAAGAAALALQACASAPDVGEPASVDLAVASKANSTVDPSCQHHSYAFEPYPMRKLDTGEFFDLARQYPDYEHQVAPTDFSDRPEAIWWIDAKLDLDLDGRPDQILIREIMSTVRVAHSETFSHHPYTYVTANDAYILYSGAAPIKASIERGIPLFHKDHRIEPSGHQGGGHIPALYLRLWGTSLNVDRADKAEARAGGITNRGLPSWREQLASVASPQDLSWRPFEYGRMKAGMLDSRPVISVRSFTNGGRDVPLLDFFLEMTPERSLKLLCVEVHPARR